MYRLVNQQDGNVNCDMNSADILSAALEALDYLSYNLQYRGETIEFPMKQKVIVEVLGGVAEVVSCPESVDVEIIDHDNE